MMCLMICKPIGLPPSCKPKAYLDIQICQFLKCVEKVEHAPKLLNTKGVSICNYVLELMTTIKILVVNLRFYVPS